jgi:very-short-patch-repair endonuclease
MAKPPELFCAAGSPEQSLRAKLIGVAREGWIKRLTDVSRRNNLIYYRPIATSTLEITLRNSYLSDLFNGKSVSAQHLLADPADRPNRVLEIGRKALENLEEKGLATLYLVCGLAKWTSDDGGRDPQAPIVMLPLAFQRKGRDLSTVEIEASGPAQINPVLLHVLQAQFNIKLDPEELLATANPSPAEGSPPTGGATVDARELAETPLLAFRRCFELLKSSVRNVDAFAVEESFVIGNFAFQKMAMVRDLKELEAQLFGNDVVAAIAGDTSARALLGAAQVNTDPNSLDSIAPDNEFAVIEADSSQQCAIAGIAAGQSAVVHGPPGTGKSQTITNLIATLIGKGKTVLFVAEKRAALEVVLNRLEKVGLGHLAIDLHGAEQTPKKVMQRIAKTLETVRESPAPQTEEIHRQFVDRRTKLNEHDHRMHTPWEPTGQTVYAMQGSLLRLPKEAATQVRWRGPELSCLTPIPVEKIIDLLQEARGFESHFLRCGDPSPWTGVSFADGEQVQAAMDAARQLGYESLPAIARQIERIRVAAGMRAPASIVEFGALLALLKTAQGLLGKYDSHVFDAECSILLQTLCQGKTSSAKALWLKLTRPAFRAAYNRVVALRKNVRVPVSEVCAELTTLIATSEEWKRRCNGATKPMVYSDCSSCEAHHAAALQSLYLLQSLLGASGWEQLALTELCTRSKALSDDGSTPYRLLRLTEIERQLKALGVQKLLDDLRARKEPASSWVNVFRHAWLQSALDEASIREPQIRAFVGSTHNSIVEDFKKCDGDRLAGAAHRVRRLHAERTIAAMNAHPEQEALIKQEATKSRSHKPLRFMFKEAGEVLMAVTPCCMASPLSVSELIHSGSSFDYVIFDEASQVLPEDAIPSILRGKHLIVAGDNKQLPPTGFFSAGGGDDDEAGEADGYESLLDMMIPFVKSFHLNWHYRSRRESLIAFSNHHIYDDRLITFPDPGGPPAVRHIFVDAIPAGDGQEESSGAEVQRVVQLVVEHARATPGLTLGVITMGIKHAMRVQGALDKELAYHPELAEFFDPERRERFFIKNLERVQGDERDSIIMSVGYGKDRAGNLPLRFGPILSTGGRRRLNVAVTRARAFMTTVSSFAYSDIDITKVRPQTGLDFLRNYIQYAASGGTILAQGELTNEPMNDFEVDVYEALEAKGIHLVPQVGCARFRIDLAACHPREPGRFVLAIECDGATYHSSYTARDRDRIRQQQLENLGWTFHRIWSTDWFMRKDAEVTRAIVAFERAMAKSETERNFSVLPATEVNGDLRAGISPLAAEPIRRASQLPPIPLRTSIGEYTQSELKALHMWVQSDGILRTHEELADEMFAGLPFTRRGARIEAALRQTIEQCR